MKDTLIALFHKEGKWNDNYELQKEMFSSYEVLIPTVEYYGNKWDMVKSFFLQTKHKNLFIICSDVSIVCGDLHSRLNLLSSNSNIGCFGFGTINNFTFQWMQYNNLSKMSNVPFIEGYCIGISRAVAEKLNYKCSYGYGLDIEVGYVSRSLGMLNILDSNVCINHAPGKNYSDKLAQDEFKRFWIGREHMRVPF